MPRRARSPSLAQDLLTLGDIYLTLGWIAIKRLRYGPLWPWEPLPEEPKASVLTLVPPREGTEEDTAEVAASRRG